jgi:NADPH2:quinone reductase
MKAIRVHTFGGPDVMRLEECPDPKPGPNQVVVRLKATGVNPVETYIRSGLYARKPPLPYTPGSDGAGTVEAIGHDVHGLAPGDRAYVASLGSGSGTYAELALCERAHVHPLPAGISFGQGAALGVPCATAYRALFDRGQAQPGETVLVHGGSGGVGIAAIQLAQARGLTVFATAGTKDGLELVEREGARHALRHNEDGYLNRLMNLTNGRGVDLIIEMAAHLNLGRDLTVLAPRGRVVVVGNRGTIEIDPRQTMSRDAAVLGMTLFNATEADLVRIHAALGASLANGTLRPVVSRELPLAEAARSHELVLQTGARGKIVLIP